MYENNLNYFESHDQFFGILSQVSSFHVSARKLHGELLVKLHKQGVAFKDCRKFLLNRAAESGLWERGMRIEECKKRSWYVSMQNFLNWKDRHYSDYGVQKDLSLLYSRNKIKGEDFAKTVVKATKTRKKNANGEVLEEKEIVTETTETVREKVERIKAEAKAKAESLLNKPVIEGLSTIQIQTVILSNLSILGKIAIEKGASEQFNAFMAALGQFDEMVQVDDPTVLAETEQMIQAIN